MLWKGWRRERSKPALRRLGGIGVTLAVRIAFDLSTPHVSLAAHLAGIGIGFLVALPMRPWAMGRLPGRG